MKRKSKNSPSRAVTTVRRLSALDLRVAGLGFEEIGKSLGISKPGAWQLVDGALKDYDEAVKEAAGELRAISLMRADVLLRGVWPAAESGDEKAIGSALKVMDHQAKLVGLYAAQKTELTGKDGGPLESVSATAALDLTQLSDAQLASLEALLAVAAVKSAT
jgi:hypothetical protein